MKPIWKRELLRMADGEGAGGGAPAAAAAPAADANAAAAAAKNDAALNGGAGGGEGDKAGEGDKPAAGVKDGAQALADALKNSKAEPGKDDGQAADGAKGEGDSSEQDGEADGDKDGEGEGDEPKLHGAPEGDYEPFKLPSGLEISPEVLAVAAPFMKELDLSQGGAQKVAELYRAVDEKINSDFHNEINAQFDQFTENPEYWKNGKLTPEAEKAYGVLGTIAPGLVDFAHRQGGLFHPDLAKVAFLLKAGYAEGDVDKGDKPTGDEGWRDFYDTPSQTKQT